MQHVARKVPETSGRKTRKRQNRGECSRGGPDANSREAAALPEGAKAILRRLGPAASASDGGDCDGGGGGGACGGEGDVVQVLGAGGDGRRGAAARAPQARRRRPRGQPRAGHTRLRLEPGPPRAFVSLQPLYLCVADGETGERIVFFLREL